MALQPTLLEMLDRLRVETHSSLNAANNTSSRDHHVKMLASVQRDLWVEYPWPELRVRRDIHLQAGQRYYDNPTDLSVARIETIHVRFGREWLEMGQKIGPSEFSAWDSDLDERTWPVRRWQIYEDDQFEVWPIPSRNADSATLDGVLRLRGIRDLKRLAADTDRADLDADMVVLFTAARLLARAGKDDAALVLERANTRRNKLIANNAKIKSFRMFDGGSQSDPRTRHWHYPVHYRSSEG